MAHILLLGQLLTSCGIPHYLRIVRLVRFPTYISQKTATIEASFSGTDSTADLASGFTTSSASAACSYTFFKDPGYRIVLEPDGARWRAMVHDNRFPGLSRSYSAAVRFKKGYRLEDFVTRSPSYQSLHIHLLSSNKHKPIVYLCTPSQGKTSATKQSRRFATSCCRLYARAP